MNQIRYFNAFLLSSLIFSVLYFVYLSLPKVEKKLKPAPSKVIKIAIITPPKKVAPPIAAPSPIVKKVEKIEPIIPMVIPKPKPKPKKVIKKVQPKKIVKKKPIVKKRVVKKKVIKKKIIKKKVVKKKIIKKKIIKKKVIPKPKPKKVIKKKVIQKKVVQEYIPEPTPKYIPEPIIKEYIPIHKPIETYVPPPAPPVYVAPQPRVEPVIKPTIVAPRVNTNNGQAKKAFLRNVRSKLIANKKYPKIAKRRHIEGSVKVRFDISAHGHVSNIRFISGKRVFHKSIRKSLERTFPMGIPDDVRAELPIPDVSVTLHFNIR